jgi:HK97 family phage major capsid protein
MNLNVRFKEINERLAEIRNLSDKATLEELTNLETEVNSLNEERSIISKKLEMLPKLEVKDIISTTNRTEDTSILEKRGLDLKEKRTIQVSSDEVLLPEHSSPNIATYPFQEVSNLVDRVGVVNLNGGETYKKTFVKSHGIAGLTNEAGAYSDTEPEFGYITISKVKVTAYTEITEELEKLPSLPYQAEVIRNIKLSLKKKFSEQILRGAGTSNTFTGLFSDKADALKDVKDLEITEINEDTLDDIIYAYGGDEEIEVGAILILNKSDLRAFSRLKTKEGRKVHDINYINHTIDGIPYIISSYCKAISDSSTTNGEYGLAYGALKNYEVPIFSQIEISKSTDYKFKNGIICYKASVFAGGNVVGYKGFIRIKKKTVSTKSGN